MDDVEPHVARPSVTHDRVQVGPVVVEGPAGVAHLPRDLGDPLVEQPERVRVGEHQAGDPVVDLRSKVVEVHSPAPVGGHLDDLVAGHRHRGGVGPVCGVGGQDPRPLLPVVLVEGAGEKQTGELAMGAGRGLEADVVEAADLGQGALQAPHQLQGPLGPLGILGRVKAGVPGERRDPLVEPGVVLHRARAERVRPRVEVEVAPREAVVVADDLRLRDLWQLGRIAAQQVGRDQLVERALGHVAGRQRPGAAPRDRALEDRGRGLPLLRGGRVGARRWRGGRRRAHDATSWEPLCAMAVSRPAATARPRTSARRSMSCLERRSVIATKRPSSYSG